MDPKGKVAVITGGASGIGRATAQRLATEGAAVMIADLDEVMGAETIGLIDAAGGRAAFVKADVTDEAQSKAMLEAAVTRFGGLDILYNNAGIGLPTSAFHTLELRRWRRVLDI